MIPSAARPFGCSSRSLLTFAALSVAVHAAFLSLTGARSAPTTTGTGPVRALAVRIIDRAITLEHEIGERASSNERAASAAPTSAFVDLAATHPPLRPFPKQRALVPLVHPVSDLSAYRPASELSVRPVPIGNIAVPYPPAEPAREVATLRMTLYIDAEGVVERADPDPSDLPPSFADAAREAFLQGRFLAGRIDGRPVPTRMRIEVAFDAAAAHVPPTGGYAGAPTGWDRPVASHAL